MTLDQAKPNHCYILEAFEVDDEYLQARLIHFGFTPGIKITLKRRAPIFKDPLLVDVDGSQIMISRSQAKLLSVKEVNP